MPAGLNAGKAVPASAINSYRCFFDVDGVLLDFQSSFIQAMKDYFQLDVPADYEPQNWYFQDLLTAEQMKEGWRYFLHSKHFEQIPPLVNPSHFNSTFGAYPVHFITNIPPDCLERRRKNLVNAGFLFDSAHCGGFISFDGGRSQTKAEVIQDLLQAGEKPLFVDDHPDNCVDVREAFPDAEVWLMTRVFNQEFVHPNIRRVSDWDEVLENTQESRP